MTGAVIGGVGSRRSIDPAGGIDGTGDRYREGLAQFLAYDIGASVASLVMLASIQAWVTSRREVPFLTAVVAVHLLVDLWLRYRVRRGGSPHVIAVVAASTWTINAIVTLVVPFVLVVMTISALFPVVVAVPYLTRSTFRFMAASVVGVITLLAVESRFTRVSTIGQDVPRWVADGIVIAFVPMMTGAIVLLLWHSSAWLREALTGAEHSNLALRVAQQRIEEHARRLQASRTRVVAAADNERRRMERDLHDGAQQSLIAAALAARRARNLGDLDPRVAEFLDRVLSHLARASTELKDLAAGIYPPVLTDHGLEAALTATTDQSPLPIRITCDGVGRYPPDLEAAIYFCCRESIQNVIKHAGPNARIGIELTDTGTELRCTVSDDGAGFDPSTRHPTAPGRGLTNMADRIAAAGGELDVRSSLADGTEVRFRLPLSGPRVPADQDPAAAGPSLRNRS